MRGANLMTIAKLTCEFASIALIFAALYGAWCATP